MLTQGPDARNVVHMNTATTTHTTYRAHGPREEATMAPSTQTLVLDFAAQFPTPQVKRLVSLCESGRISWDDAARIAQDALAKGLKAVA